MRKILIVGQTPPPFHGQSIMIKELLNACESYQEIKHVRMAFSNSIKEVGKFHPKKVLELFKIIGQIWWHRFYWGCEIIYFPPIGGDNKIPLYRDLFVLVTTRFLFKKTIFHFHAWGLSEIYYKLNYFERIAFKSAYKSPDIAIIMSSRGINDPQFINSKKIKIIPNGLKDTFKNYSNDLITQLKDSSKINILFIGILKESKGVKILIESINILSKRGCNVSVNIVGAFENDEFDVELKKILLHNSTSHIVNFLGIKTGIEKDRLFRQADIFCFPTFYECENFPNVLIEAMMYSLPIVTTDWRGNGSLVQNNFNGFLCPIQSAEEIADSLMLLIQDSNLRSKMGINGRRKYEAEYKVEFFAQNMIHLFNEIDT